MLFVCKQQVHQQQTSLWKLGEGKTDFHLYPLPPTPPKSSIEVTICTSSNILVWFGRDAPEKSVAGLRESLISSPFENLQKD